MHIILFFCLISITAGDTLHFTLDKSVDYGLRNNPGIEQLTINLEKSKTHIGEALSAYYPSLSINGYFAYISDVPVFEFDGMPIPMGQHRNYSVSVSLQQVLFAWGKLYNAYKITEIQTEIAELTLRRKQQEVRYTITDAFYGLLILEEMVGLSRESLTQLKRHEEAVRKRYKAGLVPQFELLRSQVQVANLLQQVIELENGLNLAKEGFKLLLGLELDVEFELSGDLKVVEEVYDVDELINEARENRIELKNLKNFERIADRARGIAGKAMFPALVAGATYERKKPFSFGGDDWGTNLTFNVGFQFPIFSGLKTRYQYEEALLVLREVELAKENLEKAITVEVKQAYMNLQTAKQGIAAARENVSQAKKAFEIIEKRYRNGLVTNLEYLDTQLVQTQAKTIYLEALKNYHSARAALYKAIGKEE
ncbi:MAG: TolC family protein [Candidatus Cloacimonadota bacterium]|nr:MAG: TolC family protein [Candidatus Cloacimonadota bacterium]